ARVASLQKVMAENQVIGKAPFQRKFKCVDIVNAFADEGTLTEHILVNIGNGSRVGIDAGFISKHPRIPRSVRARKTDGHARLKDTVTFRDALPGLIVTCTIQGMLNG